MAISFDTSDFDKGIRRLEDTILGIQRKAAADVATEVLRLSMFEVPHDLGLLQASGVVEPDGQDSIVGYNKVYAARLHENPQFHFQKGRKGKYLEDPIKRNLLVFKRFIEEALNSGLR